ncbi:uracil-DNA glycosylase family protein [Celeribacter halophilus]|uniref:Uracil-DNA glycosylase n=1 Tax=Celeribacter halophilus TaxID=576117 RepID=A0A1I3U7R2_9RHOB|nr:uracil-DNA glycosylase family protein [Celeribacter halophilus]PZX10195.1 uracil-DNA glycosylase [Celeribacter halophilus]SFJ77811.1 Uracil-DNA glycosylase [Celeribacter halophilus]
MCLVQEIKNCRLCAERFKATATAHSPRPVVWFRPGARILIAGQAPGARVHQSGRPFTDPSGERLRDWLGLDEATFYDQDRIAIVPMGFCFPGYDAKGSDIAPPALCRNTWHERVMAELGEVELILPVGLHALRYHLGHKGSLTEAVANWRAHAPRLYPLPHPSWRNTAWLRKNPWFEADLLPDLRARIQELL